MRIQKPRALCAEILWKKVAVPTVTNVNLHMA